MSYYAEAIKMLSGMEARTALKLIYEIAAHNPKAVADAHTRLFGRSADREVLALAQSGTSKIPCIKFYREKTGLGLKEAKEAVERIVPPALFDPGVAS